MEDNKERGSDRCKTYSGLFSPDAVFSHVAGFAVGVWLYDGVARLSKSSDKP